MQTTMDHSQQFATLTTLEKVAIATHCNLRPPDVAPVGEPRNLKR